MTGNSLDWRDTPLALGVLLLFSLITQSVAQICTSTSSQDLETQLEVTTSNVLFIGMGNAYKADGENIYNYLRSRITPAGHSITYVNINLNTRIPSNLGDLSQFTQIWFYDLESANSDSNSVFQPDWNRIRDWYFRGTEKQLVLDGRILSSAWRGRISTGNHAQIYYNFWENLRLRGGGMVIGTDHNAFHEGVNELCVTLGLDPFTGNFAGPTIPVDSQHPLLLHPAPAGFMQNGQRVIYDDSSTGQSPSGLQANCKPSWAPTGVFLHSFAYHSGNTATPAISSTIPGSLNFRVDITNPVCDATFLQYSGITFQGQVAVASKSPYSYKWEDETTNTVLSTSLSFTTSSLTGGTHSITLTSIDADNRISIARVRVHVTARPNPNDLCYEISWDLANPKKTLLRPATKFPSQHAGVRYGFCGKNVNTGDKIPGSGSWRGRGCSNTLTGGSLFYAYGYPDGASSNTGFEQVETDLLYFVVDEDSDGYFVLVHDKPGNSGGGGIHLQIDSPTLKNKGVQVLERDDDYGVSNDANHCLSPNRDCYGWDPTLGKGSFAWFWAPCCTDGMVLGKLPSTDFCFNIRYTYNNPSAPITSYKLGNFNPDTYEMTFIDITKDAEKGIAVCGYTCASFCGALSTCGECSENPACGWCGATSTCIPRWEADVCDTSLVQDQCCPSCDAHKNCQDCSAEPGCGWCFNKGKCLSGKNETTPCESCSLYHFTPAGETAKPCRACEGALADGQVVDPFRNSVDDFCMAKGFCDWGASYDCDCNTGYAGLGCELTCPGGPGNVCNGHGACDPVKGTCSCVCGYSGADCGILQGCDCVVDNGQTYCRIGSSCNTNCGLRIGNFCSGSEDDNGNCECREGWWGPECDNTCPGIDKATGNGNVCGGHGTCQPDGTCLCEPCFTANEDGICVEDPCPECGPLGSCICNEDKSEKECQCPGQLFGVRCSQCRCLSQPLSRCNSITGQCECPDDPRYYGELCRYCDAADTCSGHGSCRSDGQCSCSPGWYGEDCGKYPPSISTIPDQYLWKDTVSDPVNVQVSDVDTPAQNLALRAVYSTNENVIRVTDISIGGAGSERTLTITPVPGAVGAALIYVQVSDGFATAQSYMRVLVRDPSNNSECGKSPAALPPFPQLREQDILVVSFDGRNNLRVREFFSQAIYPYTFAAGRTARLVELGGLVPDTVQGRLTSFPFDLSSYEQVWIIDLSIGSDRYLAEFDAINTWFRSGPNSRRHVVVDARIDPAIDTEVNTFFNYYETLAAVGGGMLLATSGPVYQQGMNELMAKLGFSGFSSALAATSCPVEVSHPLFKFPNAIATHSIDPPISISGKTYSKGILAGENAGSVPTGSQSNGVDLIPIAWSGASSAQPAISVSFSTLASLEKFQVEIDPSSTFCDEEYVFGDPVPFTVRVVETGNSPYSFTWHSSTHDLVNSDGDDLTEATTSLSITAVGFPSGTHVVTVHAMDAVGMEVDAYVRFHVRSPPGSPCEADTDCISGACVDGSCCQLKCSCNSGYVRASTPTYSGCYRFSPFGKSWTDAMLTCKAEGGDLVSIGSDEELQFMIQLCENAPNQRCWVGLSDAVSEGTWKWSNGNTLPTTHHWWLPSHPTSPDCGMVSVTALKDEDPPSALAALDCTSQLAFVCKTSPGCPPGLFVDGSDCESCPAGRYSDQVNNLGQEGCKLCPAGRYGSSTGLIAADCSGPCDVGHYCEAGSQTPTQHKCPPGRYGAERGSPTADCSGPCEPGYYCESGETSSKPTGKQCLPGRFGSFGQVDEECSGFCSPGYYCGAGSPSTTQNKCGSASKYCPEGSSSPTDVPAGYYSTPASEDPMTRSSVAKCEPGSYCASGIRNLCPAGRYGSSGGETSTACSGPCSAGFFCPQGSSSPSAQECGTGDFPASLYCPEGTTSRLAVPSGHYSGPLSRPPTQRSEAILCEDDYVCRQGSRFKKLDFVDSICSIKTPTEYLGNTSFVENVPGSPLFGLHVVSEVADPVTATATVLNPSSCPGTLETSSSVSDKDIFIDVSIKDGQSLNFEECPQLKFNVELTAGAYSIECSGQVHVVDVNDDPESPATFDAYVNEGSPVKTLLSTSSPPDDQVAQLVATDEDEGQELRYSITDGNEEGYFQIGACSGILSVAQAGLDYETQPTDRELTILVEDNGNPRGSVTTLARVHTVNINESPYPDPSVPWSNFIIDENVPSGTSPSPAVAQFLDYDLQDVLHYRIKVNDKDGINNVDAFAIDPNNGTLSVAPLATIDFETKSQFRLVVEAVDAGGLMAEQEVIILVQDQNDPPMLVPVGILSLAEHSTGLVKRLRAVDQDSEPDVQMEIVDGNSNGDFSEVFTLQRVSTVEADLMVNQPDGLDFETKEAFTLSIRLTDLKDNSNIVMSVQIAVTNINEAPEVDDQVRYALENLTFPGTIMDPIAAYDVDNEKVTQTLFFSLTDSADGQFAIGPEDGILRSLKPLDYESQTQYTVVVQVTDNGKPPLSTDATVTINILNVNEPPTFLDQSVSIDENSVAGDKVNRNLDASDVDQGDTLTFAIVPGSSSYADWFVIDPSTGRLKVASLLSSVDPWASRLDFELRPTIDIRVSVTDSGMDGPQAYTAEATITIQMNDKEEAPFFSPASLSMLDNQDPGVVVGTLVGQPVYTEDGFWWNTTAFNGALDQDAGQTQTLKYTLVSQSSPGQFQVSQSGTVSLDAAMASLPSSSPEVHTLEIEVEDITGNKATGDVFITVRKGNFPPTFSGPFTFSVLESASVGAKIGTATCDDRDVPDVPLLQVVIDSVTPAKWASHIDVDKSTGELKVLRPLDYEQEATIVVTMSCRDPQLAMDTKAFTVEVGPVNEPPKFVSSSMKATIVEHRPTGSIGQVEVVDEDADESFSYSWVPLNQAAQTDSTSGSPSFSLDATTGEIAVLKDVQYETASTYEYTVSVVDTGGNTVSHTYIISVLGLNDKPSLEPNTFTVDEDKPEWQQVLQAEDPDIGLNGTLVWAIVSGNTKNTWRIVPDSASTGNRRATLSVAPGRTLDFEDISSFNLQIQVKDKGPSAVPVVANFGITIADVPDAQVNAIFGASVERDLVRHGTRGGDFVVFRGSNLGRSGFKKSNEPSSSPPVISASYSNVGPSSALGKTYEVSGCEAVSGEEGSSIRCPAAPGAGRVRWSLTVDGAQVIFRNVVPETAYSVPVITGVTGVFDLPTSGGAKFNVSGTNFGPFSFSPEKNYELRYGSSLELRASCVLRAPFLHEKLECTSGPGAGKNLLFQVVIAGIESSPFRVEGSTHRQPIISEVSTPSVQLLSTLGQETVVLRGSDFGPLGTTVSATYGSDGGNALTSPSCSVRRAHVEIECSSAPGSGTNLVWRLTVNKVVGPASTDSVSYAPPAVSSVSGPGAIGASTEGGDFIFLLGSNFGPALSRGPAGSGLNTGGSGAGESLTSAPLVIYGKYNESDPEAPEWLEYTGSLCNVTKASTTITCYSVPGSGANFWWRVKINGQWSPVFHAPMTGYHPPVILSYSGEGKSSGTDGGELVDIHGTNFGPKYNVPRLAQVLYGVNGDGEYMGSECEIVEPHTRVRCLTVPGTGSSLAWEMVVDGQESVVPATSYGPAEITSFSGPAAINADTQGGETVIIHGKNFGPPVNQTSWPNHMFLDFVSFGQSGRERFLYNTSCTVNTHHEIECITPPGTGQNLVWQVSIQGQLGPVSPVTWSYSLPEAYVVLPLQLTPTSGGTFMVLVGKFFGFEDPLAVHSIEWEDGQRAIQSVAALQDPEAEAAAKAMLEDTGILSPDVDPREFVTFQLPEGYGEQNRLKLVIDVAGQRVESNSVPVEYDGPMITAAIDVYDYSNEIAGTVKLAIHGINFCADSGCGRVLINGQTPMQVLSWSHEVAVVVTSITSGEVVVEVVRSVDEGQVQYVASQPRTYEQVSPSLAFLKDDGSGNLVPSDFISELADYIAKVSYIWQGELGDSSIDYAYIHGRLAGGSMEDKFRTAGGQIVRFPAFRVASNETITMFVGAPWGMDDATINALLDRPSSPEGQETADSIEALPVTIKIRDGKGVPLERHLVYYTESKPTACQQVGNAHLIDVDRQLFEVACTVPPGQGSSVIRSWESYSPDIKLDPFNPLLEYAGPPTFNNRNFKHFNSLSLFFRGQWGSALPPHVVQYLPPVLASATREGSSTPIHRTIGNDQFIIYVSTEGGPVHLVGDNFGFSTWLNATAFEWDEPLVTHSDCFRSDYSVFDGKTTAAQRSNAAFACATVLPPDTSPVLDMQPPSNMRPSLYVKLRRPAAATDPTAESWHTSSILDVPEGVGERKATLLSGLYAPRVYRRYSEEVRELMSYNLHSMEFSIMYLPPDLGNATYSVSSTAGGETLVIRGQNFGPRSVVPTIKVGGELCEVDADERLAMTGNPHREVHCKLPPGSGAAVPITMTIGDVSATGSATVSYPPPAVNGFSVAGGRQDPEDGIWLVSTRGGEEIVVHGSNFGEGPVLNSTGGARILQQTQCPKYGVYLRAAVGPEDYPVLPAELVRWSHEELVFSMPPGYGLDRAIEVIVDGQSSIFETLSICPDLTNFADLLALEDGTGSWEEDEVISTPDSARVRYERPQLASALVTACATSDTECLVKIRGDNFGNAPVKSSPSVVDPYGYDRFLIDTVTIGGKACHTMYTGASGLPERLPHTDTEIQCYAPPGQGVDLVSYVEVGKQRSDNFLFSYSPPTITRLQDNRPNAAVQAPIFAHGENFGSKAGPRPELFVSNIPFATLVPRTAGSVLDTEEFKCGGNSYLAVALVGTPEAQGSRPTPSRSLLFRWAPASQEYQLHAFFPEALRIRDFHVMSSGSSVYLVAAVFAEDTEDGPVFGEAYRMSVPEAISLSHAGWTADVTRGSEVYRLCSNGALTVGPLGNITAIQTVDTKGATSVSSFVDDQLQYVVIGQAAMDPATPGATRVAFTNKASVFRWDFGSVNPVVEAPLQAAVGPAGCQKAVSFSPLGADVMMAVIGGAPGAMGTLTLLRWNGASFESVDEHSVPCVSDLNMVQSKDKYWLLVASACDSEGLATEGHVFTYEVIVSSSPSLSLSHTSRVPGAAMVSEITIRDTRYIAVSGAATNGSRSTFMSLVPSAAGTTGPLAVEDPLVDAAFTWYYPVQHVKQLKVYSTPVLAVASSRFPQSSHIFGTSMALYRWNSLGSPCENGEIVADHFSIRCTPSIRTVGPKILSLDVAEYYGRQAVDLLEYTCGDTTFGQLNEKCHECPLGGDCARLECLREDNFLISCDSFNGGCVPVTSECETLQGSGAGKYLPSGGIVGDNSFCESTEPVAYCAEYKEPISAAGWWRTAENNNNEVPEYCKDRPVQWADACPMFIPCEPPEACIGDNKCAVGYDDSSERCSKCADNFRRLNGRCQECPDNQWLIVLMMILGLGGLAFAAWLLNTKGVDLALISIGIDYCQVLAILRNADIAWPPFLESIFSFLSAFNLNLDLAAPECALKTFTYVDKWFIIESVPLMLGALMMALFGIVYLYKVVRGQPARLRKTHGYALMGASFVSTYYMYIFLCRTTFDIFNCSPTVPDDGWPHGYLSVVFERCFEEGGTHLTLFPWAIVAVFAYVISYPVLVFLIIVRNKRTIKLDQYMRAHGVGDDERSPYFRFRRAFSKLYQYFKPTKSYWIVYIIGRKLCLAVTGLMFRRTPSFQLAIALMVLFLAFVLHMRNLPYMSRGSYDLVLVDHEKKVRRGEPKHALLDSELRESLEAFKNTTQSKVKHASMERIKSKSSRKPIAIRTWDNNTIESVFLFSAVLVCLSGIMFESDRFAHGQHLDERDALGYIVMLIIVFSFLFYFIVFASKLGVAFIPQKCQRWQNKGRMGKVLKAIMGTQDKLSAAEIEAQALRKRKGTVLEMHVMPTAIQAARMSPEELEDLARDVLGKAEVPDLATWNMIQRFVSGKETNLLSKQKEVAKKKKNRTLALVGNDRKRKLNRTVARTQFSQMQARSSEQDYK